MDRTERPYKRYLMSLLALVCFLQVVLGFIYWELLQPYLHWQRHRVVEVTSFPPSVRRSLIDAYLANTVSRETRPLILVLGDSESYGAFVDERFTFSHLLAQRFPSFGTYNVSIKGAQLTDIDRIIDSLQRYRIRPAFIIFDIDFASFTRSGDADSDASHVLATTRLPMLLTVAGATVPTVRSVYDFGRAQSQEAAGRFSYLPLPRSIFPTNPSDTYDDALVRILTRMKAVSANVIAYVPPFAVAAFERYGFDETAFRRLAVHYVGMCASRGVRCLDLSEALPLSNFMDIIHLNRQGHVVMASRLERAIKGSGQHAASKTTATRQAQGMPSSTRKRQISRVPADTAARNSMG